VIAPEHAHADDSDGNRIGRWQRRFSLAVAGEKL